MSHWSEKITLTINLNGLENAMSLQTQDNNQKNHITKDNSGNRNTLLESRQGYQAQQVGERTKIDKIR